MKGGECAQDVRNSSYANSYDTYDGVCDDDGRAGTGKDPLREAMEEVATGLNRMYEIRANSPKSGLLPSEVTVVFNISASATDKSKLYIEAGAKAAEIFKVTGAGAEVGTQVAAARGNTVTVKFTNVLFAPKDTLVMHKSPEDLKKLLEVIKQSGIEIQMIE